MGRQYLLRFKALTELMLPPFQAQM